MSLFARIAKMFRRRSRVKGTMAKRMNARGRNWQGVTAVDLWQQAYRFKETPPARAGQIRAAKRLAKGARK